MNPIERKKLKTEEKWDKERAKDAKKREKKDFLKVEEAVLEKKEEEAMVKKRAEIGKTPLGLIQRDFVNFLRGAHRSVTLEEASKQIRFDIAKNAELLERY